ncbi:hypothetical protein DFH07DRAFT_966542 [Mycena maculata]|uniref:Uncharacterized protein n=1 Tax=Mycena maculata TaxID=230809 RepID=A0AAD7I9V7_9AGAR|nr:hypothetical protein DFH07DRAFT_966542 [Mycena maculata]
MSPTVSSTKSPQITSPSTLAPPLNLNGTNTANPFATSSNNNTLGTRSIGASLKAFSECALKRVKLDPATESKYKLDERDTLQTLWMLELTDKVNKLHQDTAATWEPSTALQKAGRKNIYSALLLPNIHLYSGNVDEVILHAMRHAEIPEVPVEGGIGSDEFLAWLGRDITLACSSIKKTIGENMKTNHVPLTLGLLMRIALLCRLVGMNHSVNTFCNNVDEELEVFAQNGPDEFVENLETLYELDIKANGDPSKVQNNHTIQSFNDPNLTCPSWLKHLHSFAPQVKRAQKGKGRAARNKKRKRTASDVGEGDATAAAVQDNGGNNEAEQGGGEGDENGGAEYS